MLNRPNEWSAELRHTYHCDVTAPQVTGTTKVSEVMTSNPRSVSLEETVENCMFIMREFGFRHLPICEGTRLRGLVSLPPDTILPLTASLITPFVHQTW